jgi:uncharacterized protein (TIGR02611 family)
MGVCKWCEVGQSGQKGTGVSGDRDGKDHATSLDRAAQRYGLRRFVARNRGLELAYRVVVAVIGFAIIITGLALIPLPGPGWLIVFGGLAVLSTEFAWADRLLRFARSKVQGWTEWVLRQSLAVRALIGLVGLAFVAGAIAIYAEVVGLPEWLPVIG